MNDDYGWARLYSGKVLHYYADYPFNPATAICGKVGYIRMHFNDHADDIFALPPQYTGRFPKCKKCLSKLEGK